MKRSFSMVIIISVMLILGCSKQSDTYFPTKEGLYWEYQKHESGMFGMQDSSKHVRTTLKERDLSGKKVIPIKIEESDMLGKKTAFVFRSEEKDGLAIIANQPVNSPEPIVFKTPKYFVKFPIKVGTEWEEESRTYLLQKVVPITIKYSIVSVDETVTVPVGNYNKCLKITGSGNTTIDMGVLGKTPVNKEVSDWYAPNVGFVKSIIKENSNNMLVGSKTVTYQLETFKNN